MPNDAIRLRTIRGLVERGHLAQVLISHDICYRSRLVRWGGHGYRHIFANVVPLMRRRDFSEAESAGHPRRQPPASADARRWPRLARTFMNAAA
jgi:phosphotriesterase-related protein